MLFPFVSQAAPPPVITAQPADITAVFGGTATFTVAASSSTTLSYQWYKDGLLILDQLLTGETRSSLVLNNVASADEGQYFVKVSNAGGTVTSRKASLTVVPNVLPVANNDTYTTLEDVPLVVPASGVLTNDTDANGQTLTAVLMTNVTQGSLSLSPNGAFVYTPPSNYFGSVSFTYRVSDGYPIEQNYNAGDKTEVKAGNMGAQSFRHGTVGGASYMISKLIVHLSRKSSGSGSLNFSIGTGINAGPIAGTTVAIPSASITNISEGSSFQTYAIVYNAPAGPFTAGTTYYLNFDTTSTVKFYLEHCSDAYANGTYYENGSNQGEDLWFHIYEDATSNPATVTINVTPVNDAPVANIDWIPVWEDTQTVLTVLTNDYDVEGSLLTITGVFTTNGTAFVSGTNIVYTPATNYNGWVLLNYTVSDGSLSSTGLIAALVFGINDAPVIVNDTYTTGEDVPLTIAAPGVTANDPDVEGDPLFVWVWNYPTHGTLNLNTNGGFTYVPFTNYYGTDTFTYYGHDGQSWATNLGTVTINITPVNDAPIAVNDSTNVVEDGSVTIKVLANDFDPEGTPLTIAGAYTTNGTALISGANIVFKPATNFTGTAVFSYTVSDGTNLATASVTVTVAPLNDAPVALNDAYTVPEDSTLTVPVAGILSTGNAGAGVLANDTDADGDPLTAMLVSSVSHGQLNFRANGSFVYTPDPDYNGTDSFTYRAADGTTTGNIATVTITVTPVSDPLQFTAMQMTPKGFQLNVAGDVSPYVISASSDLQNWTPLYTNSAPTGPIVYTDTAAANYPARYYRVDAR